MAKLITVHGTGAGIDADTGRLWWQEKSAFLTKLDGLLDLDDVEIIPFHWGEGANSETARRKAGRDLNAMLHALDEAGEDYALIAHSHGGMVVYNALLSSVSAREPLKRLLAWCTIGTPFLDVRPRSFLFQRLDPPGLAVLILALAQLVIPLSLLVSHLLGGNLTAALDQRLGNAAVVSFYLPLMGVSAVLAAIAYGLLLLYDQWRNRWFSVRLKRRTAELYAGSWIGLTHEDDEALAALRSAARFRPQIIPRDVLAQGFAMLPVIVLAALLIAAIIAVETQAVSMSADAPLIHRLLEDLATAVGRTGWFPGLTTQLQWAIILAIALIVTTAIVAAFRAVGRMLGRPFAAAADRVVWRSIRERVWGDDLAAERIVAIAAHPPMFGRATRPLPEALASQVEAISDAGASETLRQLRSQFGIVGFGSTDGDPFTQAFAQLSWRELIHTTYFDVDDLVRLIALGLHRRGLAGLNTAAWTLDQKSAAREMLTAIQNPGGAQAADSEAPDRPDDRVSLSVFQKTLVSLGLVVAALGSAIVLTALFLPLTTAAMMWLVGGASVLALAAAQPVSLKGLTSQPDPARNYDDAMARFQAWIDAPPEAIIHPRCHAYVMTHNKRTPAACVLIHGISNCPYSMVDFAPRVHAMGLNVIVVRMPFNGHLDNATDALRHLTAAELARFGDRSVDIACGLGDRVVVLGISAGGVIAAWLAQHRGDIDHAIPAAPSLGLAALGSAINLILMHWMLALPHFSVWKDPIRRSKGYSRPHSYKRQSTRGMGEVMRLGWATLRKARRLRAPARRITLVTNGADVAIDPSMVRNLARAWRRRGSAVATFEFDAALDLPHELIDPTEEGADPMVTYPELLRLIASHE